MTERELSAKDFAILREVFNAHLQKQPDDIRARELAELFHEAHTGWLELEQP